MAGTSKQLSVRPWKDTGKWKLKQGRSITWPLQSTVPSSISYNEETKTYLKFKITVLWDLISCSLVDDYQGFGGKYCRHLHGRILIYPDVGVGTFFQNICMISNISTQISYNKISLTNVRLISHTSNVTTENTIILKSFSSCNIHVRKLKITSWLVLRSARLVV
jgi:hypothetical protein